VRREYPSAPIAAVGAIVRKDDQVLLVRRGQEPAKGRWVIPGGAVELGEATEEAVRREIREESGIEISVGPLATVVDRIERDEQGRVRYHYLIVDLFASYVSGEPRAATDAAEARWVSGDELANFDLSPESLALCRQALG
jgi:8-oxo-dGTP diphosphatase